MKSLFNLKNEIQAAKKSKITVVILNYTINK